MQKNTKYNYSFLFSLIAILSGIAVGFSHSVSLQSAGFVIATLFMRLFKCVSVPIIALSIIVTFSQFGEQGKMSRLLRQTLLYTVSTTLIAAIVSAVLYLIMHPANINLRTMHALSSSVLVESVSYTQYLISLVPANLIEPFLHNQAMSVLLVSIVIGAAMRLIPDKEAKDHLIALFKD